MRNRVIRANGSNSSSSQFKNYLNICRLCLTRKCSNSIKLFNNILKRMNAFSIRSVIMNHSCGSLRSTKETMNHRKNACLRMLNAHVTSKMRSLTKRRELSNNDRRICKWSAKEPSVNEMKSTNSREKSARLRLRRMIEPINQRKTTKDFAK